MTDRIFAAIEFVGWLVVIVAAYALLGLFVLGERIGKALQVIKRGGEHVSQSASE